MKDDSKEEILQIRINNIKADLEMLEKREKRIEQDKSNLILKLISTRETLLGLEEQDE